MDPEAALGVAGKLDDVAVDLRERSSQIDQILSEAGEDSIAPQDALRVADLCEVLAQDIRTRVELLRVADARGMRQAADVIVDSERLRDALKEINDHDATQLIDAYDKLNGGQESAIQLGTAFVNGIRFVQAKHRLAELKGQLVTKAAAHGRWPGLTRRERGRLRAKHNQAIRGELRAQGARLDAADDALRANRPIFGFSQRFPSLGRILHSKAARGAGKALAAAGIVVSGFDFVQDVTRGDVGGAVSNAFNIAGGVLLLTAGPVGLTIGAVFVAGSLIYEFRDEIKQAGEWVGDRVSDAAGWVGDKASKVGDFFGF